MRVLGLVGFFFQRHFCTIVIMRHCFVLAAFGRAGIWHFQRRFLFGVCGPLESYVYRFGRYLGYVHIDFLDCRPPCSHERTGQLQQKASLPDACELLRHQSNILLSQWSGGCTNKYKELKQFPDMPYKRGHFYLITRFPPLFNTNVHTPTYAFSCSCFTG